MNRTRFLFKNMALLTISNFASKILVFFLVPLYTSILTTAEYGIFDLVVSTVSLLFPILTLNIVDAVMRFSMDKAVSKVEIASIGIKYISYSVVGIGVFLVIISKIGIWKDIQGLEIYLFLYYICYAFNQFFVQFAKGLEKVTEMSVAGVLSTIVMISANLLFLLYFKWGLQGFLVANILSQCISVLFFAVRIRIWSYVKIGNENRLLTREMLVYSIPLITTVVGWWVNSAADRYVVAFMCGVAANGILSVSYKIPQIINVLQSIFIQAWQISAIKEYEDEDSAEFYGKSFAIITIMMCAACSWLILLDKVIAKMLYANDFYVAWQYVPFLLISSVFNCSAGLLGPILSAKKNSRPMAIAAIYGSVTNVILNVFLVALIGIQGATIATVISSVVIYMIRKRAVGKNIKIVGYTRIVFTWILLCIQAIIEIYIGYWQVEVLIMLIALIVNWKIIREMLMVAKGVVKT